MSAAITAFLHEMARNDPHLEIDVTRPGVEFPQRVRQQITGKLIRIEFTPALAASLKFDEVSGWVEFEAQFDGVIERFRIPDGAYTIVAGKGVPEEMH